MKWNSYENRGSAAGRRCRASSRDGQPVDALVLSGSRGYLAATLASVSVAAGEVVIREGEVGDRFYIVDHGQLEVVGPGVQATAGAGDYFGEIALIRDVPRTATVTAVADSQLYAMERSDFVAAVTSHSGVRAAGEEVVEQRHGNATRVGESA